MKQIRLKFPLRFDHFEIPIGTVIAVPIDVYFTAVSRGIAESAEPERAVVQAQEKRRYVPKRSL
jgi:hypothetical protein